MPDFNHLTPPRSITDPNGDATATDYPRHVYDKQNQVLVVTSEAQKAAALKDGYALKPYDLSRPKAMKGDAAA